MIKVNCYHIFSVIVLLLLLSLPVSGVKGQAHPDHAVLTVKKDRIAQSRIEQRLDELGGRIAVKAGNIWVVRIPETADDWLSEEPEVMQLIRDHPVYDDTRMNKTFSVAGKLAMKGGFDLYEGQIDSLFFKESCLIDENDSNHRHGMSQLEDDDEPGTSDEMRGTTAVAVFFFNNTGDTDPIAFEWTDGLVDSVYANVIQNLTWWTDRAEEYDVDKKFELVPFWPDHEANQLPYDPTLHQRNDAMRDIMKNLGYDQYFDSIEPNAFRNDQRVFLNDLRDSLDTDWAFMINIIAGAQPFRSTAVLFGPYTNLWYGHAMQRLITAHEVGHIYGLRDEYASVAHFTRNHKLRGVKNKNADFRNPSSIPCIMKHNWGLCSYTVAQLGWINEPNIHKIQTEPEDALFTVQYKRLDTGELQSTTYRLRGDTGMPWTYHTHPYLFGASHTTFEGYIYDDPVWDISGQKSANFLVQNETPGTISVSYNFTGEKTDYDWTHLRSDKVTPGYMIVDTHMREDGLMAFSSNSGISVWDGEKRILFDLPPADRDVDMMYLRFGRSIAEGPDGNLYFAMDGGEIFVWKGNDNKVDVIHYPGFPQKREDFITVEVDSDRVLWAAADDESGLHRYEIDSGQQQILNATNTGLLADNIRNLTVDDEDNIWMVFGTWGRSRGDGGSLQMYNPEHDEWEKHTSQLPGNSAVRVKKLADRSIGVVTTEGVSIFDGNNWDHLSVPGSGLRDFDINKEGTIYVGTLSGLFRKDNEGVWEEYNVENSELTSNSLSSVNVGPEGHVLLGTTNRGVTMLSPTDLIKTMVSGEPIPKHVELHQNYPNPFNPVTEIRFQLPVNSDVRLEVFDITGQKVTILVNELVPAGTHKVTFDASELSSGVYIYRLMADEISLTHKMTLIK